MNGDPIRIICPNRRRRQGGDNAVRPGQPTMACGFAEAGVTELTAELSGGALSSPRTGIRPFLTLPRTKRGQAPTDPAFQRWVFRFDPLEEHERAYTLTVSGMLRGVPVDPAPTRDFLVRAASGVGKKEGYSVTIASHEDGDNITDEAQSFVAWGTLVPNCGLTSVTMNNIGGDVIFEDWRENVWTATFPPLTPGVYTLRALDDSNHSDSRGNLEVRAEAGPTPMQRKENR